MCSWIRTSRRPSSLRARLTAWYLLFLGSTLLLCLALVFVSRVRGLSGELDAEVTWRARQTAIDFASTWLALDVRSALQEDAGAHRVPLVVRDVSGAVLFRSPVFPPLTWDGEQHLTDAARDTGRAVSIRDRRGLGWRVATVVVERPGATSLTLQMGESDGSVRHAARQLALVFGLLLVVVLVVAGYGGCVLARRALAPVDAIVEQVRQIQATRPGDRLGLDAGSEELNRLIRTLNQMLDRLEVSVRGAQRFAAHVSHELQTPIAAMRSMAESGLGRAGDDRDEMVADLLAELERLSTLVRDLRVLTATDGGHLLDATERVDLAALTSDACEIAAAMAVDRQIAVDVAIRCRPVVSGSTLHLRRVLLNLVENAIKYSRRHGRIDITLDRAGDRAVLSVADRGYGIPPADLPHVFEPFYRADPARSRATGGAGLGLAIVSQIVRLHAGDVSVTSEPGVGSCFTVHLPAVFD